MLEGREPPAQVMAELREIHPGAAALYMGHGRWWLGAYEPFDRDYYEDAGQELERVLDRPLSLRRDREIAVIREKLRGFTFWAEHDDVREHSWGRIREDFRMRHWWVTTAMKQLREQVLDYILRGQHADLEARQKTAREFVRSEGRSIFRYAMKGRRGVLQPGLN